MYIIRKILLAGMVVAIAACGTTTKPLWQSDLENLHRYHRAPTQKVEHAPAWHNPKSDYRGVPGLTQCKF